MSNHPILSSLNDKQRAAVSAEPCHMLVLAGAGSGKTRVLVHRLAWLFEHYGVSPYRVLSVTFTNKAAKEMRSRIEQLFQLSTEGLWVGTFHGIAHRLLRVHYEDAKLPQNFQVLDSDDQYRLIRRILKNLGLDEKHWSPKQVQHFINKQKDNALRPHAVDTRGDSHRSTLIKIYQAYQENCDQNGLVDFAELLLRAYELWRNTPEVLKQYRERFQYVLVDEFQDTNTIQYKWLKLLIDNNNYMMVVGDDDQSIYAWRGAKIENIHRFQDDFSGVKLIRLEQNYRSTKTILDAANAVINHNPDRLGKELWTEGSQGAPIDLYAAFNEIDEARYIVSRIKSAEQQGYARNDFAILYRSNAQSRVLEEALLQANVPYQVYGGQRFFERAEIKNALAYLRLITAGNDDTAFERVVNTPTRGLGDKTLETIRQTARGNGLSMWKASQQLIANNGLPGRAANALAGFLKLIDTMTAAIDGLSLGEQVQHVIAHSGLVEMYEAEPGEKGQSRVENLTELATAASQFNPEINGELPMSALNAFLAYAVLESGEGQADYYQDSVQLMTLHSAKGLEFPIVTICGMEEEIFPAQQSAQDPDRLAEERRLCYVGMTRAKEQLILTYAEYRRLYGESRQHRPSRFIREIPKEHLHEVRMKSEVSRPQSFQSPQLRPRFRSSSATGLQFGNDTWKVGQRVAHPKFGDGIILNYEGNGDQARIQVHFSSGETKWLVAAYAKLQKS